MTDQDAKELFTNVLFSLNNPLGLDVESLSLSLEMSSNNYTGISACDGILCDKICDGIVCDQICDGIICDGIICDAICDKIF